MTSITTSETLVERLRQDDNQPAWDRLYCIYAPVVKNYAISKGCNPIMADDVVQLTFVTLLRAIHRFRPRKQSGQFRAFLFRIVKRRIADLFADNQVYYLANSDLEHRQMFEGKADASAAVPGENWDVLYENNLMAQALEMVKQNIKQNGDPITIKIFDLYVIEGASAGEVCQKIFQDHNIHINENKIYQDKSRVIKMWKDEFYKLRDELGEYYE